MPKTPLQLIQHHYKDQIKREQKKNEFFYSQTDTFITWLIGFAFTGMILIISNLKAFSIQFNSPLKAIVVSLLITISFGILFRFISFMVMIWERDLEEYYALLFSSDYMTPLKPTFDLENASIEQIVSAFGNDFGIDYTYALDLNEPQKSNERLKLIDIYIRNCETSKHSFLQAREFIAKVEYDTHRINPEKNIAAFNKAYKYGSKGGYDSKLWGNAQALSFILTLGGFGSSVLIVGISLLRY